MPISIKRLKGAQSHADLRHTPSRKEISLPVTLISTTNMLSYEAPDLPAARQIMAARTSQDSDTHSPSDNPGMTPDASSAGSSPAVEYNHLSAYFPGPTIKRTASARQAQTAHADAPALPQRVPSHSKREHERLARKRSLSRTGKTSPSVPSSPVAATFNDPQRTSLEMIGVTPPEPTAPTVKTSVPVKHRSPILGNSPFSPELEKLNEVAEDFKGMADEIEDEDSIYMRKRGLVKLTAADYRTEIGSCYSRDLFEIGLPSSNPAGWI